MNTMINLFYISLLLFSLIEAGDENYILANYNVKFQKHIKCTLDTLLHLDRFDLDKITMPSRDHILLSGPHQFKVDSTSIYFLDYGFLYKYNYQKDSLIWMIDNSSIIDFTYYNERVYIYTKDKLMVYDADDGRYLNQISLTKFRINTIGAFNQCFFFDKYFFLAEDDFPKDYRLSIKEIYDMEQDRFINTEADNFYDYYPITNCTNCDIYFRMDIFDAQKWLSFLGQSDKYIFFEISCISDLDPKCPEKTLDIPGIYKKSDNSFCLIDLDMNISKDKYNFSHLIDKEHAKFVNDTSFVYQARRFKYIPDENPYKFTDLIYVKATFRTW